MKSVAEAAFSQGNGVILGKDAYAIVVDPASGIGKVVLLDLGIGSYRINEGKIIFPDNVPIIEIWDWRNYVFTLEDAFTKVEEADKEILGRARI